MIVLPPKYLKPIYMNVNSSDFQTTTSTTDYTTDYSATQNYQFEQTTASDYQVQATDYNTTSTTDYNITTGKKI